MVDCHTHVFPPKIAPKLAAAIGREFGTRPAGDGSAEDLLKHLDRAGLSHALCFTAALRPDQLIPANSWMLSLRRAHSRLIPLGTVHPDHPSWEAELDRLERNGIRGLKIHPDLCGIALDSPRWNPVWEAAQGRFLMMIHMGPIKKAGATLSRPRDLALILKRFPGLAVIAAHLGGLYLWEETLAHLAGLDLYMDTSCCPGVVPEPAFAAILKRHDPERILFGSDYPLFAPDEQQAALGRLLARIGMPCEKVFRNGASLARRLQTDGFPDLAPPPGH
ncbi:MAG: amidohydrolase family protein [Desulfomicrobium apsheronum]|nr:amidohydrolase family protein [Desulfomicrobium apsheronum]